MDKIPEGYMRDARGALIPISKIKPVDLLRDQLVRDLAAKAEALHRALCEFKAAAFGDIAAFVQASGEQYGVQLGGAKGNVTLSTFDGRFRVQRQVQDTIVFDERLQAAKALIDECIQSWSQGSTDELKVLVNDAFRVDQAGDVNTGRVLGLRRLDIRDPRWLRAMEAVADSLSVVGSRSYVRVYERVGDTDAYRPITLDLASVPL